MEGRLQREHESYVALAANEPLADNRVAIRSPPVEVEEAVSPARATVSMLRISYFALFMAIFDALRTLAVWPEEDSSTAWSAAAVLSALEGIAIGALHLWSEMLGAEPSIVTRSASLTLFLGCSSSPT